MTATIRQSAERIAVALERLAERWAPVATQMQDTDRDPEACPKCGEDDLIEDTSAPGTPMRRTCKECGTTWQLELRGGVDRG